jgi:hypothetical protein
VHLNERVVSAVHVAEGADKDAVAGSWGGDIALAVARGVPDIAGVAASSSGLNSTNGAIMTEFKQYRRKRIAELRPWQEGDDMTRVSVSAEDKGAGSPKLGDMVARNSKNHGDQWLVAAQYFADNFEPVE